MMANIKYEITEKISVLSEIGRGTTLTDEEAKLLREALDKVL